MKTIGRTLVLASLLSAGCGEGKTPGGAPPSAEAPQRVALVAVEAATLDTSLALPAQILPYEVVDVYPKVAGFLESITVDRGSHVRAGELIIRLSAPELVAQKEQAASTAQGAEAKLASDEGTYLRLEAAAKTPGVVAENDLEVQGRTVAADKAQVEAAQGALRSISQLESYLDVKAPFDGVVTLRNLHPGALVGTSGQAGSQPIVQISDLSRLRVVVPVPEAFVAGVKDGQEVGFSVPAYPGRTFRAPVARVSHDINKDTRTMLVELDYRNGEPPLTPGTYASVEWPIQRSYKTLFVPATAVTTDLQRTFVICARSGKAEWVDVKTGGTMSGKTEVFGDLKPAELVVQNATDALKTGTALQAQSP